MEPDQESSEMPDGGCISAQKIRRTPECISGILIWLTNKIGWKGETKARRNHARTVKSRQM